MLLAKAGFSFGKKKTAPFSESGSPSVPKRAPRFWLTSMNSVVNIIHQPVNIRCHPVYGRPHICRPQACLFLRRSRMAALRISFSDFLFRQLNRISVPVHPDCVRFFLHSFFLLSRFGKSIYAMKKGGPFIRTSLFQFPVSGTFPA